MTIPTKKEKQSSLDPIKDPYRHGQIEVLGAREHNLKNIDVTLPRNKLVVITGVSGSGKSSLAFDTIYAEGKRRYMESFTTYARSFIGNVERPDVDKINGLSPVIAIEQKTTSRNPRSTVGTATEIYDFLRLLFAKTAEAYSYLSGSKMRKQTDEQIQSHILQAFAGQRIILLAPIVKGRKGHYRELLQRISNLGFSKVRIDGEIRPLTYKMQLDRYKTHDIEVVIDGLLVTHTDKQRLQESLGTAWKQGKGTIMLQEETGGVLHHFSRSLMDPDTGLSYDEPAPNTFSFNSPYGACPTCNGLGEVIKPNIDTLIPDKTMSISQGGIAPLGAYRDVMIFKKIEAILKKHQCNVSMPIKNLPTSVLQTILHGDNVSVEIPSVKHPETTWSTNFEGVVAFLIQEDEKKTGQRKGLRKMLEHTVICPDCQGNRLKKEALHFKIADQNIAALAAMDMQQLYDWFSTLIPKLDDKQQQIANDLVKEIRKRIRFLLDVGLQYLQLGRPLNTLSGGESQRIRLATQIGTQLVGVLYILDEPSIGLHQRDNTRLIYSLKKLRDLGNSVVVVEHDKDMMLNADYVLDVGPGAGQHGGNVVAAGPPHLFLQQDGSTAAFLRGESKIAVPKHRRTGNGNFLTIKGCRGNNLKNITLNIPLGKLVCVTGVSGSGKSSLIHETLFPILQQHFYKSHTTPLPYDTVEGLTHLDKVVEVDQAPIGKTPRSSPATYTGVFSEIRTLFTQLPEAKIRGYQPGRFSFNVKGGRCATCEGAGLKVIEMDFLPAVHVPCETCNGKRYNRETLEIKYKGKSISDVLEMTISNAADFFAHYPKILRQVNTLAEVGLGYMTLGQHATTLSGGEAQRVKLATELSKEDTGKTLYILDEPTTGLHFQDIQHLLSVLNKLVDKKNTVLVIEHNMDIIKVADYVIDIGLEGGQQGGKIVVEGAPGIVAMDQQSHTARFLRQELEE
ncbi:MAG: excinuclease ABC subunit UvrA [Amoebophilaceae bacterium]|jgi:excinuclease ABC subunit A|nr:excinuclease ABC subunit UvrA [Amoebophilaceae bacterium]